MIRTPIVSGGMATPIVGPPPVTPEARRIATLAVIRSATDNEDCRQLLDMLGLLEDAS